MKKLIEMWKSASLATKQRTIIFFITWIFSVYALINSIVTNGFDITTIQTLVATIVTGGASILNWWKNNSFTAEAITADEFMGTLKQSVYEEVETDDIVTEDEV